MAVLLVLLVAVAFLIWFVLKSKSTSSKRASITNSPSPTISVDFSPSHSEDNFRLAEVQPSESGHILLNPGAGFPLNLSNGDIASANMLRQVLDDDYGRRTDELAEIIAKHNIRFKEVDDYVKDFRPKYLQKIEELKGSSPEWVDASEKDREDMLAEFREKAQSSLDVRPFSDIFPLFENEPKDLSFDDPLVSKYGFDNLTVYMRYADNLEKVRVIPADHYDRKRFEALVEHGMANRGNSIPLPLILDSLKLKEMNEIAGDTIEKQFGRKNKAIEHLSSLPDIDERLGKAVAFRELFQLKPLPEGLSAAQLDSLRSAWDYYRHVAALVQQTYTAGKQCARNRKDEMEFTSTEDRFEILTAQDERTCPYCQRAAKKSYTKRNYPKLPLHLGCRCCVVMK